MVGLSSKGSRDVIQKVGHQSVAEIVQLVEEPFPLATAALR